MTSQAKRVLLYDHHYTGHHLKHVQSIVKRLSRDGHHVWFASSSETYASEEYRMLLSPIEECFQRIEIKADSTRRVCPQSLVHSQRILKMAQSGDYDLVLLPCLDAYFFPLGMLLKLTRSDSHVPIEGILFYWGQYAYEGVRRTLGVRLKTALARRIIESRGYRRLLFIDELQYTFASALCETAKATCELCPDPVEYRVAEPRETIRRKYGIPQQARVLGLFGSIRPFKGVDFLIKAFTAYGPKDDEYLLLMGKHSKEVVELLASQGEHPNIISVDTFVSDDDMMSAMGAVDVIAATYKRHVTSSSMVIFAAAAGKPILASDYGWIGHAVKKHDLGHVCDVPNEESLLEGIRWAFNNPTFDREKAKVFAAKNSLPCFLDVVCRSAQGNRAAHGEVHQQVQNVHL